MKKLIEDMTIAELKNEVECYRNIENSLSPTLNIVIEGSKGTGKTYLASIISTYLTELGYRVTAFDGSWTHQGKWLVAKAAEIKKSNKIKNRKVQIFTDHFGAVKPLINKRLESGDVI